MTNEKMVGLLTLIHTITLDCESGSLDEDDDLWDGENESCVTLFFGNKPPFYGNMSCNCYYAMTSLGSLRLMILSTRSVSLHLFRMMERLA